MKYVRLRPHTDGPAVLLFCTAPMTHRKLAQAFAHEGAALSAGFCRQEADGRWSTFGDSSSLCLGPLPEDAALITGMVRGTAAMAGAPRPLLGAPLVSAAGTAA